MRRTNQWWRTWKRRLIRPQKRSPIRAVRLPIGSRGGIAIRHEFPLDAEYVIKVRLQRGKDATTIVGNSEQRELDIRLDGARLKLFTVNASDDDLEVRAAVKAGPHIVAATF